ncbi:MAG: GAF domain-containing protein [Chloroflexota bacterium]|nr:GAF domain-containing protein [Chloroflexota bacterium]
MSEASRSILAARVTGIRARLIGHLIIILILLVAMAIIYAVSLSRLDQATAVMEDAARGTLILTPAQQTAAFAELAEARQALRVVPLVWGSLLALVIVGTTIITFYSIARPLEQITEAASALAAGQLDRRVDVEWVDEFGRLGNAFNEMADRLQSSYAELEQRVLERTRAFQRRDMQLRVSAVVSRAATSILDVDELLRTTVNLIHSEFNLYFAAIFLLDEAGEWVVLREATGGVGQQLQAEEFKLALDDHSMVGWTAAHRQPRIALDVGGDAVHLVNQLLPDTRSEMTLPLVVGERLLGVLDAQSAEEAAFDEEDVQTLRIMADQIAVAIDNARKFSDEAMLVEATSPLYRVSRRLTTAMTVEEVAEAIVTSVAESGADGCHVALIETPGGDAPEMLRFVNTWRRDHESSIPPGSRLPLSAASVPLEKVWELWSVPDIVQVPWLSPQQIAFFEQTGVRAVTNIPLAAGKRQLGFVTAYRTTPGPFSAGAQRLYEVLSDQAAVALERARLAEEARVRTRRLTALYTFSGALAAALDVDMVIRATLQAISDILAFEYATVSLVDVPRNVIEIRGVIWEGQLDAFPEWMEMSRYSLDYPDIQTDIVRTGKTEVIDHWDDRFNKEIWEQFHHERLIRVFMPIRVKDRVLGTVEAGYDKSHKTEITPEELELLAAFMDQAALALERAYLLETARQRVMRERTIRELSDQMLRATDMESLMRITAGELNRALSGSRAYVRMGTEDSLRSPVSDGQTGEGDA